MPEVLSASAGAASATGCIPLVRTHQFPMVRLPPRPHSRPHKQVQKVQYLQETQVSRPVLMALPLLPVGLRYAWFGSFEGLGQMLVGLHSEAAPSPGGFSPAMVSDGKGENDDE